MKDLQSRLEAVRDAGALDDNHGGVDWTHSDKFIDETLQAIQSDLVGALEKKKREVQEYPPLRAYQKWADAKAYNQALDDAIQIIKTYTGAIKGEGSE